MLSFSRTSLNDKEIHVSFMNYEMKFIKHDSFLSIEVISSPTDFAEVLTYWSKIAEISHKYGYKKILISNNPQTNFSVDEYLQFTKMLPEIGFADLKTAYVNLNPMKNSEARLAENFARQNNINGMLFYDFDTAKSWLLKS